MAACRRIGGEPTLEQVVDELFHRFREKYGRDPGPNDHIFCDPDLDQPIPLTPEKVDDVWNRLADACVDEGEITPEMGYAMKKTGRFVTEETKHLLSKAELDEWDDAIEDYFRAISNKVQLSA